MRDNPRGLHSLVTGRVGRLRMSDARGTGSNHPTEMISGQLHEQPAPHIIKPVKRIILTLQHHVHQRCYLTTESEIHTAHREKLTMRDAIQSFTWRQPEIRVRELR